MNSDDEIESSQNRGKSGNKDAKARGNYIGIRKRRAVGRIKSPARINATSQQRINRYQAAQDIDVPTQQIYPWEGEVLRSNHHRDKKVTEGRRYGRNQKEKDHYDAVLGKDLIVGCRLQK